MSVFCCFDFVDNAYQAKISCAVVDAINGNEIAQFSSLFFKKGCDGVIAVLKQFFKIICFSLAGAFSGDVF